MTPQDLFNQQQGQIDTLIHLCSVLATNPPNPQGVLALLKAHSDRVADQASATAYAKGVDSVVLALQETVKALEKAQSVHPAPGKAQ